MRAKAINAEGTQKLKAQGTGEIKREKKESARKIYIAYGQSGT